ncbi:MAG: molybdenum cofactor guanylyltransferase [Phycisphaerales bacterium]|nr:MAG: molybdenum cofactor guanylyltransferase [Phycisphaerales bacterium]
MIKVDGMLMVGSAGANVGKTELACALLRKFAGGRDIVGIKVTTIKEKDGQCPRGGEGCGVCSSLDANFLITAETDASSDKDTSRLLSAGASRVLWLRVLKDHLAEGAEALLTVIGSNMDSICESNSFRHVVEPGLFLMVESRGLKTWKNSAQQVRDYADRIVVSDGSGFDLDFDQIELSNGEWRLRGQGAGGDMLSTLLEQATAIILAGGTSDRMGADKSMLPVGGRPLIEHIAEQLSGHFGRILVSANDVEKFDFLGLEVIPDKVSGQGPLMGIASALESSASDINFVVACDIPHVDLAFVEKMARDAATTGADIMMPITKREGHEPLFAVYRKSALKAINKVLSSGRRKISDAFALCRVNYIELGDARWLVNLNTAADYEEFQNKRSDQV